MTGILLLHLLLSDNGSFVVLLGLLIQIKWNSTTSPNKGWFYQTPMSKNPERLYKVIVNVDDLDELVHRSDEGSDIIEETTTLFQYLNSIAVVRYILEHSLIWAFAHMHRRMTWIIVVSLHMLWCAAQIGGGKHWYDSFYCRRDCFLSDFHCTRLSYSLRETLPARSCQGERVRETVSERQCQRDSVRENVSERTSQRDSVRENESERRCQRECVREKVSERRCQRERVRENVSERTCQREHVRENLCQRDRVRKNMSERTSQR